MRRCIFSIKDDKGVWVKKEGFFHKWGSLYYTGKYGEIAGTWSVAIVEDMGNGDVHTVHPDNVKFLDRNYAETLGQTLGENCGY